MKRYLLYIVLTVVLSTAGCTRGQWLDEVVAQRDEQEDVVPILRAAKEKGLTVDSAEEIERTNKYYTVDTANGYYNEFKRYRLVFSDQTTVEFDVLGLFNGVQREYYAERGLDYISSIDLVHVLGNLVIDIVQSDDMIVSLSFPYTTPNGGGNTPENNKIYYTSTDGNVVTPYATDVFGANIVSNTYENGQGVITFDGNVTKIGDSAFYDCLSLASITIPDSVTSIGSYAFYACSSLAEVYCKATTPPTAVPNYYSSYWRAFDDNASGRKIYVPAESVEAYKTTHYWSNYADAFVPYDFENGEEIEVEVPEPWEIYYTSTDGNVVTPYYTTVFGANIVSNTYENGKGVITFDGNVTSIGEMAFFECSSLASITIPDGVTSIGGSAFWDCDSLTSITIPDSVNSIEEFAFYSCDKIEEFRGKFASDDGRCLIVNGVLNAFAIGCGLTWYIIPEGVTSIGSSAFYGCSAIESITIPDGVTSIGSSAFYGCSSLTSITIPNSVTEIETYAFMGCRLTSVYCEPTTPPTAIPSTGSSPYWRAFNNNASGRKIFVPAESVEAYKTAEWWSEYADDFVPYDFEKGEVVNLESRKIYYTSTDGNVVTPYNSGTSYFGANIVSNTYENGQGVITFDGNVTKIGDSAFYDCSSLASITIPDSVTSIGGHAFAYCPSLASITIPEGVTSIGEGAFSICSSLTSITIPDSVTSIGEGAFSRCSSLTSITIPDSVTSIGGQAFGGCSSLASITIPDSVTSIGNNAFYGCSSLASINIPDSVTSIGWGAFFNCSSLASVYCKAITPPTAIISDSSSRWDAFDYNASGRKIYVPTESVEAYKTAKRWSEYADAFVPYDFEKGEVVNLENRKIYYTSTDGNVVTPYATNVFGANIVSNTYENGKGVITFDGNVTKIGYHAFAYCSSLANITIPEGVTEIGEYAFYHCKSLASVTIGEGVTSIGNSAFVGCSSLASVTIPDSVTSIGDHAFNNCYTLPRITIPESVTEVGYQIFWNCRELTEVYCKPTTPPAAVIMLNYSPPATSWILFNSGSNCKVYVPAESVEAYKTAEGWSAYADAIEPYVFE